MKEKLDDLIEISKDLNIMVVDDNKETIEYLSKLLEEIFGKVYTAKDGKEALEIFSKQPIDLLITDLNMPRVNGLQLIENIRFKNNEVPIIILSAYNESEYFMKSIEMGINGYVLKPVNMGSLVKALYSSVELINLRNKVEKQRNQLEEINNDLEQQVIDRISQIYSLNQEIKETQKEVVFTMGSIGERRCKETGNHVKRVSLYSELFAQLYGLSNENVLLLKEASPMHDIGKVAIPDAILNKAGRLTQKEMEIMKTHALLGYDMLKHSQQKLLQTASIIALEHHEKYDGSGYPNGLKGEEISIYGRITAIADVFDALGSERIYKKAWSDEMIFLFFQEERGQHFDPRLVDIFFQYKEKFLEIRDKYKDI